MSAFFALSIDAVRDALRRRSLLAAGSASALVALVVNRCTGCETAVTLQGQTLAGADVAAMTAVVSFGLLGLWAYAMAALLASDELATALEDGTAESVLARPVSRDTLCLARLVGALAGTFAVGLPLFALAAVLLQLRQGLEIGPAAAAAGFVALGTWSTAALAMTLSLSLPRSATLLAMTIVGLAACGADVTVWMGRDASGLWSLLGHVGPGWLSGPLAQLGTWLGSSSLPAAPPLPLLRAALWGAASTAALVGVFRRRELAR